ncbi:MAG: sigma-70 family RNA polymerase sigma factor [Clostridiales bacterium]|nr:sigma-70 family RNA polymerase sigma factor [Clostridiales bacterium]
MKTRVDICGLDTSTLPKLTHEEMMELIAKAQNGDEAARELFIMANLRLVLSVTQRFAQKKQSVDDIFQVGCIGLIKAMENFNVSYNLRFSTYAVPMIIGEIRRFMRDCSPLRVSRSVRDTAYHALQARQQIEHDTGDAASLEDIAAALNLPISDVVYALDGISDPISLFEPVYHDGDDTVLVMDQLADDVDENRLSRIDIDDAVSKLGERERKILMMRFYDGKTQMEVSKEIGISQAQVSRLEKTAIATIHSKVAE